MSIMRRVRLCAATLGLIASSAQALPGAERDDLVGQAPFTFQPPADIAPLNASCASCSGKKAPSADNEGWIESASERYESALGTSTQEDSFPYDMQVFISTGMPDGVLQQLFEQALAEEHPERIRFVVRGFEPQQLGKLIFTLRSHFPDPSHDELVIEVDPNVFREHGVEAVPVYHVYEPDSEKWFEVYGAISLDGAREHVAKRGRLVVGELYDIAEPDILSIIEERARHFDAESAVAAAAARAPAKLEPNVYLPQARVDAVERFDPVFIAPEDVSIPAFEGYPEVPLAKKGQVFRVLDYSRLPAAMIVFDPADRRQWRIVQRWLIEAPDADLFVTGTPHVDAEGTPRIAHVAEHFKRPVYPWLPRYSQRFGVHAVPALVDQPDERALRIRYEAPTL